MSEYGPEQYRTEPHRDPSPVRPLNLDARAGSASRPSRLSHISQPSPTHDSTRSWVYSTQLNPPPPPPGPIPYPSPVQAARGLSEVQFDRQNDGLQPSRPMSFDREDEEYMNIDPQSFEQAGYGGYGWTTGGWPEQDNVAADAPPELTSRKEGGKGFVGGFFTGLRRLPKVLRVGRKGDKIRKPQRKGTFNTEGTEGGLSAGTLPRYASNPSTPVVPGGYEDERDAQYAEAMQMPVPSFPQVPTEVEFPANTPVDGSSMYRPYYPQSASGQNTPPPPRRRQPSLRVTPPSLTDHTPGDETPRQGHSRSDSGHNNQRTSSHRDSPSRSEGIERPNTTSHPTTSHTRTHSPPESPHSGSGDGAVLADPRPTDDYRKMTPPPSSSAPSEPPISDHINRVHQFLKDLHHLPWIKADRITVDYRPGTRGRAAKAHGGGRHAKGGELKELTPKSWYNLGKHHHSVDLLSNGTVTASSRSRTISSTRTRSGTIATGSSSSRGSEASPRPPRRRRNSTDGVLASSPTLRYQDPYHSPPYDSPNSQREHHHRHHHGHGHGRTPSPQRTPPLQPHHNHHHHHYPHQRHHHHYSRSHTALPFLVQPQVPFRSHGHQPFVYPQGYIPYSHPPLPLPLTPPVFTPPQPTQPLLLVQPSPALGTAGSTPAAGTNAPAAASTPNLLHQQPQPQTSQAIPQQQAQQSTPLQHHATAQAMVYMVPAPGYLLSDGGIGSVGSAGSPSPGQT